MGPMQFIPETWRLYGVDANNDGVVSPDNIDDAALSAAGYLCWRGKDLATPRGLDGALRAYNLSDQYARDGARLGHRLRRRPPAVDRGSRDRLESRTL